MPKIPLPHVCIITPYCYPLFNPTVQTPFGGSEVRIALIAKELARRGAFRVSLVVGDHGMPHIEQRDGVTLYSLVDRPIWGIPTPKNLSSSATPSLLTRVSRLVCAQFDALNAKYSKSSPLEGQVGPYVITPEMITIYDEVNADIYVVPGNSQFSTEVAFYTKLRGKKYVFLAGSDFDYYPEYKQYPDRQDMYGVPFVLKTYAIESANAHIVQSERQASLLQDGYGRIGTVIKNPIDLTLRFPRDPAAQNILWVGKSEERIKRPSLLLELARQLPQYPFTFILTRAIEKTHEECLKLAEQLPNVTLIERLPFVEIERYFAKARLNLNTSVFEGFPNTFLQAAKYGVPTVSIQVDPCGMLAEHCSGLVCGGDFEKLKANVSAVMTDDALYDQLGRQALAYVHAHHDKNVIIPKYEQVLK
jgi:glycosyltransferase involved in cell wall biosynthesis